MSDDYDYDQYDDEGPPCPRCDGHRTVNCYCGGDFCVCQNYGEASIRRDTEIAKLHQRIRVLEDIRENLREGVAHEFRRSRP